MAARMLTLKQILLQVRPGDWFLSVDLKDAYFHIHVAPPVLEIHVRGGGIPKYCPSVWTVSGTMYGYEVHGCSPFPPETEGNVCLELTQ